MDDPRLSYPSLARTALCASMTLLVAACATSPSFDTPDAAFKGRVNLVDTPVVVPGTEVKLAGRDFTPGQQVRLTYGGATLGSGQPVQVGADGTFSTQFKVPADAPLGQHPIVIQASQPAAALVHPLKVSPDLPLMGQERFDIQSRKLVPGLYQAAYSTRHDRVFVTSAVGRPPVTQSELVKVNPTTLAIEARVTPPAVPVAAGQPAQGVFAVYGVGVDDSNDTVWVTNTRQNTVAVYRQSDLGLLKQFDIGTVNHARDVIVDEKVGKVYASATGSPMIAVFDAKSLTFLKNIEIKSGVRGGGDFMPMSLELDRERNKLYTVSMSSEEAVIIDTRTDTVEKVFKVEGSKGASGVAFDPRTNRLLVASQGSDNLLFVDVPSGKTVHDLKVGAGPLNVALDHVKGLAYVPNRASGTVTVVNAEGQIVANLPGGTFPNHAAEDGKGTVFAINKSRGAEDPEGDLITRITPR